MRMIWSMFDSILLFFNLINDSFSKTKERCEAIRRMERLPQEMERLPQEMMFNVLSRLSAKDLTRCKCVCKAWFDLITNPDFISNYYIFYNSKDVQPQERLLLIRTYNYRSFNSKTEISIVSWNPRELNGLVSSQVLNCPRYPYLDRYWEAIMGPFNGIYFLKGVPYVIMNPSLRQFIPLPKSHFTNPRGDNLFRDYPRFGFDPKTNDYKVVVFKYWSRVGRIGDQRFEIYSLNSNSWRNLGANVIPFPFKTTDTYRFFTNVNNCCHWLGYVCLSDENENGVVDEDVVLSFDMVNELFRKIKVPKTTYTSGECIRNLIPFNESATIGLIDYQWDHTTRGCCCFEVWMLKNYWDEGSWIKQYNVSPTPVIYRSLVGYCGSNQFLWEDTNERYVLYGPDREDHNKDLLIWGDDEAIGVVKYMESLVSLQKANGNSSNSELW